MIIPSNMLRSIVRTILLFVLLGSAAAAAADKQLTLDIQRETVNLNGTWQSLPDQPDAPVWQSATADALPGWQPIEVPGPLLPNRTSKEQTEIKCVWARREFTLDRAQASRAAVLKWNGIRFGPTIWINGQEVATHPAVGPATYLLPASVLHEGANRIVIRAPGWGGVRKSRSAYPLIPTGASTQSWGTKQAAIFDDVWIESYDRAYMRGLLAMPRLKDQQVVVRIWFDAISNLPEEINLEATLSPPQGADLPPTVARLSAVRPAKGGKPVDFSIPIKNPLLWTPQSPHLYTVKIAADAAGRACDTAQFRFGFREISVEEGHYRLNGKPLWLHGSNMVNEWHWAESYSENVKRYLVDESFLFYAQLCMEHTEAMRRLQFDLILPYMYAGWTSFDRQPGVRTWRDPYPTPMAASLHSCMAPVLASLDLFDANYVAGSEISTPLWLINELPRDISATVDVYVTPQNPLFLPDSVAISASVSRQSLPRTLNASSIATEQVRWKVPEQPGVYYVAAVLTREGERPVVSQRELRAIASPLPAQRLKGRKFVVLGGEPAGVQWLQSHGAEIATSVGGGKQQPLDARAVVVWNAAHVNEQRQSAPAILQYVNDGGRLVILDHRRWDWRGLIDINITDMGSAPDAPASRAFPCQAMEDHPIFTGLPTEALRRWNGLPGTVASSYLAADLQAAQPVLWANSPREIVAMSIPKGKGEIFVCLLEVKRHLEGESYDPAAVQVLLNLLVSSGNNALAALSARQRQRVRIEADNGNHYLRIEAGEKATAWLTL